MNCPHCESELKTNTIIDLLREILAKVSHCPNNGIKEIFDKEFHRGSHQETQLPSTALEDQP